MTIREAIIKAVTERNALMAGRIADRLRFQCGCNYRQIQQTFTDASGMHAARV